MTQEYTPVAWQDETTSQQGTLINAERLNQMQQAHHYADGLEEVDAVPTADPGVSYHKIVYCTADSTIYRWDGTAWTADIDDETKALLQEEIARATEAEGELAQDIADEATARETADTAMQADISALQDGKLDKHTEGITSNATKVYGVKRSTQKMLTLGQATGDIPMYSIDSVLYSRMPTLFDPTEYTVINYGWATAQIGAEATARADADTALGGRIDTEQARAEAAEQANAQAIANTYTKAEIDTALALKADKATTYTKTETDALLALKADQATTYTKTETDTLLGAKANDNAAVHLAGNEDIGGTKTFTQRLQVSSAIEAATNLQNSILDYSAPNNAGVRITMFAKGEITDLTNRVAVLRTYLRNGGHNTFYITQMGKDDQGASISSNIELHLNQPTWGNAVLVPSPASNAPSNAVATLATLDGYTPMVRTTGNQTKTGTLTFRQTSGTPSLTVNHAGINIDNPVTGPQNVTLFTMGDTNGVVLASFMLQRRVDNGATLYVNIRNADGTYKLVNIASGNQ